MRRPSVPLWIAGLLLLPIAALILILWSVKRRRRAHLDIEGEDDLHELVPSIVGLTQSTLLDGNRVELVQNGEFWEWVFRDIAAARHTINYETFLSHKGQLTTRMTEALCRKAAEGVEVRMMLDSSGGRHFPPADIKRLKAAGVRVGRFHPFSLGNLGLINNRDHRKLLIVDGRIGYIGGHCLADTWLGNAEDKEHFRDISARVEGPVVAQLQSAFAENWIEETGEVPAGERFFPKLERCGDVRAHVVWTSPTGSPSTVKLLHYLAIHAAKKSITIQNPYFLPDPDARKALVDAAKRGVTVRIMIPATHVTDHALVQHASHHHYGTLLKGGVKLYDYERTLLHQKVIVIDGCWAAVGSTNFDDRSFEVNDEVSMVIYDERIARELEATFERDKAHAKEMRLDLWKKRPVTHKLRDFVSFLFNEQL